MMKSAFNPTEYYGMKTVAQPQGKYQPGESVMAMTLPSQRLVVRRFVSNIYYCTIHKHPNHKELVYFERELQLWIPGPSKP